MTLAQLRYFCTAARYHSITKAAQALFVTQPTLSIAIRELEKEFSVTLFTHANNHLTLTEEGEAFYRRASDILSSCEDLHAEYARNASARRSVRIGIPPMLSTVFFPELLDAFHEEYPDIWLELLEYGSVRCCDLVQDEVIDLGLVNMELPHIDKFNTLVLLTELLRFGVCRNHRLAGAESISLKELDGEPLLLYNQDSVQNRILQAQFDALRITPRIVMRSSQIPTVLKFLRQGRCGAFFYEDMLPLMPEVTGIPLVPEIEARVGLVWKRGRYISTGTQSLLDFCRKRYRA